MKIIEELAQLQILMSRQVVLEDRFRKPPRTIAGVDLAFINDEAIAACATQEYESLKVLEQKTIMVKLDFPYKPGLLWFREGPALLHVVNRLENSPDIILINAHGIAHPRRFGCASHAGITLGKTTIGVAGSKLYGKYSRLPTEFKEYEPLLDNGETIGWVIKPAEGRPIYVSSGHMISLESTVKITSDLLRNHRFPEPLYLAHKLANAEKRRLRS